MSGTIANRLVLDNNIKFQESMNLRIFILTKILLCQRKFSNSQILDKKEI